MRNIYLFSLVVLTLAPPFETIVARVEAMTQHFFQTKIGIKTMNKEKKSLMLTEDEISILTLALANQRRGIAQHIDTLRTVCSLSDATEQNRKDLNNRMDDYFNAKELQSFLWGVFDNLK